MMNSTPLRILATLDLARAVADEMQARLLTKRDVIDLSDLAHIQTTIKKIEELLSAAVEYEEILCDRLRQTAARVDKLRDVESERCKLYSSTAAASIVDKQASLITTCAETPVATRRCVGGTES